MTQGNVPVFGACWRQVGRARALTGLCCVSALVLLIDLAAAQSPGLKGAYGFNEAAGSTVSDASGFGNGGTISGATWTVGRFGNALQFNGTSALVTVADSPSLRLTAAMTLEAWVFPTSVTARWTDVIMKWNDDYYLSATSPQAALSAMGGRFTTPLYGTSSLPVNTWSHLAATYDGTRVRLYVNGVEVSSRAQTGSMTLSGGPLSFGGDGLYGQYFAGKIDEVRIYDRALAPAEIQTDMTTPISGFVAVEPTLPPPSSALLGAAPNPFTSSTRIRLRLASAEKAKLRVFDVTGRLVRAFDLQQRAMGEHDVVWNGTDESGAPVATGVYIARLDVADGVQRMRIILLK